MRNQFSGRRYALLLLAALLAVMISACNRKTVKQGPEPHLIGVNIVPAKDGSAMGSPLPAAKALRPDTDLKYREHVPGWMSAHKAQASANPQQCVQCHEPQDCVACHRNEVPASHKKGEWVTAHKSTASKNRQECDACHTPDYCLACHTSAKPVSHDRKWVKTHGAQSMVSGAQCSVCHKQSVCADCHKRSKPASHGSTWKKSHGEGVKPNDASCATCHGKDACKTCHGGVDMPHPANFVMVHKSHGASLATGSVCFKCHEQKYCAMCHAGQVGQ